MNALLRLAFFLPLTAMGNPGDFLKSLSVPEGSPWEVTGAASLGMASGNADTLTTSLQLLGTYEKDRTEAEVSAGILYSENQGVAVTENYRIDGRYSQRITDRFKVGAFASFLSDNIADLDYRFDVGVGFGYHLIKNDTTKLSFDFGPGYTWEQQAGVANDFVSLRLAQKFEYKITDRSKIWQSLVYAPQANDFENSLLTAEAGIDFLVTEQWGLRSSVRYQYDNTPAAGNQKDDLLFLTGITYKLGGIPAPKKKGRKKLMLKAPAKKKKEFGWSTTASFDFSMARGNADNLLIGLSLDTAYRQKTHETFFESAYQFSRNGGQTAADSLRSSIQHNRKFGERFFIGSSLSYFRDDIANVTYRIIPAVTAGYYLVKNDKATLSLELGPGYTFEEVGGVRDDFLTLNLTEKFTWNINDQLSLKQSAGLIVDPGNSSNSLLNARISLETKITSHLAWRLVAAWTRDNTPAAGLQKDDSTLTTGISIQF